MPSITTLLRQATRYAPRYVASARATRIPIPPITRVQRRSASSSVSAVEAPDHLDENERSIFDKIKAELQPEKLEVRSLFSHYR